MTPATLKPWIELARLTVGLARELIALAPDCRSERQSAALAALRGEAAGKAAAASSVASAPLCRRCYWKSPSRKCDCPGGPFEGVTLGDNAPGCPRFATLAAGAELQAQRRAEQETERRCGNCSHLGGPPAAATATTRPAPETRCGLSGALAATGPPDVPSDLRPDSARIEARG